MAFSSLPRLCQLRYEASPGHWPELLEGEALGKPKKGLATDTVTRPSVGGYEAIFRLVCDTLPTRQR